ncbi:unnamed protein product [Protopolystoma xenopodis]|uniref:Ubiquitin-like domain-containing protein n=1 Tax=Protopolystoma xenopodis TaxID=117903 RepID=A0A3S5CG29_9PLAT|nr:unnamed protein product [Protopolystoma xenopodis]
MSDTCQLVLTIKFKGQPLTIGPLLSTLTINQLKDEIFKHTNVSPENQKLLGLKPAPGMLSPASCLGLKLSDSLHLSETSLSSTSKLMLMGSTQDEMKTLTNLQVEAPDVVDDFDIKEKIERRSKTYKATKIADFRESKRLLVLDIDYTIFGHSLLAPISQSLRFGVASNISVVSVFQADLSKLTPIMASGA